MSALLTADWFLLDSYYRKFDLYNMTWAMDQGLDNMIVVGAPYGGPIAIMRDRKQYVRVMSQAKPIITIYNGVGDIISKIVWNNNVLVLMGWSDAEQLLCVQESGDILAYDMYGVYQKTFSLGQEVRDTKVYKAQFFPNPHGVGLGVITTTNRMFLVTNVQEPKIRSAPDLPRANEPITSWCILSSGSVASRASISVAFLVCRDKDVFRCQMGETRSVQMRPEIKNPYTQILSIVPSINGRHVAFFTDSGHLWIGSSDFKTKYCEIDTENIKAPKELVWCGTQAVLAHWDDTLSIYSFSGGSVSYPYDSAFHIIQEMDCVRIISDMTHELLQKVPAVVEKIFRINSTAAGSYLVEASKQYQKRSHRADEYIRLVKPELAAAVKDCIEAASYEFDTDVQKMLIRAAKFGKGFLIDGSITDQFVKTCNWLRVLNSLRDTKVAIPLTHLQAESLTAGIVVERVVSRRRHRLAKSAAAILKVPHGQARVLQHWANYKVSQAHVDTESVAREVGSALRQTPGASLAAAAAAAASHGRKALAIKILEYEVCSGRSVPLLLSLGEGGAALRAAAAAGDTALLRAALLQLHDTTAKRDFELMIRGFPLAHALYIKHCASHNREALRKILVQEDDFMGQAATHIRDAIEQTNPGSIEASLISARECYKKAKNDLGASIFEDARKLCKQQSSLQETYGESFVGRSLHDTVKRLLEFGEVKLADKLRAEYKMPDRRYWWLRILTLASINEWSDLEQFSRSRKPPAGYEPFVDACLLYKERQEAMKYLPKCRDEIKVKYYVKAEYYVEAAQVAFEQKDESALVFVQSKCPPRDAAAHASIANMLELLRAKK